MPRRQLAPLLALLLLVPSAGCDLGFDYQASPTLSPDVQHIAETGFVTLEVVAGDADLTTLEASSGRPDLLAVEAIDFTPPARTARLLVHGLAAGDAYLHIVANGDTDLSRTVTIEPNTSALFWPVNGPSGTFVIPGQEVRVDALGRLDLLATLGPLVILTPTTYGRGVLTVPDSDAFFVDVAAGHENSDTLHLGPAAPGTYEVPLTLGGSVDAGTLTYTAVDASTAVAISIDGVPEPTRDVSTCVTLRPQDADGEVIFAPQAEWFVDGATTAAIGDRVCYDHVERGTRHALRVRYGGRETSVEVRGDHLVVTPN